MKCSLCAHGNLLPWSFFLQEKIHNLWLSLSHGFMNWVKRYKVGIFFGKYGKICFWRPDLKMIILIDSNINMINVLRQCLVKPNWYTRTLYSYQLMTKSIDQEIKWIKLFVKSTMQMNDFVYHMSIMLIHIISKWKHLNISWKW